MRLSVDDNSVIMEDRSPCNNNNDVSVSSSSPGQEVNLDFDTPLKPNGSPKNNDESNGPVVVPLNNGSSSPELIQVDSSDDENEDVNEFYHPPPPPEPEKDDTDQMDVDEVTKDNDSDTNSDQLVICLDEEDDDDCVVDEEWSNSIIIKRLQTYRDEMAKNLIKVTDCEKRSKATSSASVVQNSVQTSNPVILNSPFQINTNSASAPILVMQQQKDSNGNATIAPQLFYCINQQGQLVQQQPPQRQILAQPQVLRTALQPGILVRAPVQSQVIRQVVRQRLPQQIIRSVQPQYQSVQPTTQPTQTQIVRPLQTQTGIRQVQVPRAAATVAPLVPISTANRPRQPQVYPRQSPNMTPVVIAPGDKTPPPNILNSSGNYRSIAPKTHSTVAPVTSAPTAPAVAVRKSVPTATVNPASAPAARPQRKSSSDSSNTSKNDEESNASSENKVTYPSLMIYIRPCLREKLRKTEAEASRKELDQKVKARLTLNPARFTEQLLQKCLLKVQPKCPNHPEQAYKLGMYSNTTEYQHSGGYVWVCECCPGNDLSLFVGSIFESNVHSPVVLFKLIYHWACQTSAPNMIQWVKVSGNFLKNFCTLLRSACVAAVHERFPPLGGKNKRVEIAIITLSSGSQGQQKVKLEILGVLDPAEKLVRFKIINWLDNTAPQPGSRSSEVQWPLTHWINKESDIVVDNSLSVKFLLEIGFKKVHQINNTDPSATPKVKLIEYMTNVIPRMFHNTLSSLSCALLQQFLDELSWREYYGLCPADAFENIMLHLADITQWDVGESVIQHLNRISLNPFGDWSYTRYLPKGIDMLPGGITGMIDIVPSPGSLRVGPVPIAPKPKPISNTVPSQMNGVLPQQKQDVTVTPSNKRKLHDNDLRSYISSRPKPLVLQEYYYATIPGETNVYGVPYRLNNMKCPLCTKTLVLGTDVVSHLASHADSFGRTYNTTSQCDYCLKAIPTNNLNPHIISVHKKLFTWMTCLICDKNQATDVDYTIHMWTNHTKSDMPYKCTLCSMRSSLRFEVIDHFKQIHADADFVLCPLCLQVFSVANVNSLKELAVHIQNHISRKGRKCPKCTLVFLLDQDLSTHLTLDHTDDSRRVEAAVPMIVQDDHRVFMAKPPQSELLDVFYTDLPEKKKAKVVYKEPVRSVGRPPRESRAVSPPYKTLNVGVTIPLGSSGSFTLTERYNLELYGVSRGVYNCMECDKDILALNHFPGFMKCNRCRFSTSCSDAMTKHCTAAHGSSSSANVSNGSIPVSILDDEAVVIHCACGFNSAAVQMAQHLVHCDKFTAFSRPIDDTSDEQKTPPDSSDEEQDTETPDKIVDKTTPLDDSTGKDKEKQSLGDSMEDGIEKQSADNSMDVDKEKQSSSADTSIEEDTNTEEMPETEGQPLDNSTEEEMEHET